MNYNENEIKPILKVTSRRNMTVGELKKALNEFPDDRKIHVTALTDSLGHWRNTDLEIKDVSFVVEMDKNITHPVLNIDKIEFEGL